MLVYHLHALQCKQLSRLTSIITTFLAVTWNAAIRLSISSHVTVTSLSEQSMQASVHVLQVLPAEPTKLLEGLFIFSLIWSIGATTETAGRTLFNHFLRKLLRKGVEESPDRTEFDLGPGVTIATPEFDLRPVLPVVRADSSPAASRTVVPALLMNSPSMHVC